MNDDIIVKDRRDTQYGHKLNLTTGLRGMVLDVVVEEGNPADSSRLLPMYSVLESCGDRISGELQLYRNVGAFPSFAITSSIFRIVCGRGDTAVPVWRKSASSRRTLPFCVSV